MCLAEAAERAGLNLKQVIARLGHGWTVERALTAPLRAR